MVWGIEDVRWERQYRAALDYYQERGNLDIPSQYETPEGLKLGQWLKRMRQDYKKGVLAREAIERLEAIGVIWDVRDRQWEEFYKAAQRFYQEHGNLKVAPSYVDPDGVRLGTWVQRQRRWYKQGRLSAGQIKRLESIKMIWNPAGQSGKHQQKKPEYTPERPRLG